MAAKTGSTFISGTMIDSIEILTMTSSRKCFQMIVTTTEQYYSIVFSYALPLYMYICNQGKCENDIFARLSRNKCADENEKREYYCYSMSVYGCILSSDIYSVARVISISDLDNHIATSSCWSL